MTMSACMPEDSWLPAFKKYRADPTSYTPKMKHEKDIQKTNSIKTKQIAA